MILIQCIVEQLLCSYRTFAFLPPAKCGLCLISGSFLDRLHLNTPICLLPAYPGNMNTFYKYLLRNVHLLLEENTCLNNNFSKLSLNMYCPPYQSYLSQMKGLGKGREIFLFIGRLFLCPSYWGYLPHRKLSLKRQFSGNWGTLI